MKEYLEIIMNALIIKKEQAILMLEFLPLVGYKYTNFNPPSLDNLASRSIIYDEMKLLNKRGV